MNQILCFKNSDNNNYNPYHSKLFFKLIFVSCFIVFVILSIFYVYNYFNKSNKEKLSRYVLSSYNISRLYSNINNVEINNTTPFVIGIIRIEKIDLNYPILSESNEDLLKISICRFAGPIPNSTGNLCLAGHNYVDYRFFSRLNQLNYNDVIEIYDLDGNLVRYLVYEKFEIWPNDNSCTNQFTGGNKIITLLTCNNVNGKRLVVKAKESN